ncbi:MAG TPA: c-type cytochrome [Burkholderiales bacterium]|jgi:cytochrome c5|nr:c-type cytochrome [Burkholderiales bacterium]
MAEVHLKEHSSPIKTPKQLIVVIVLCFLVTVLGIVMIAVFVTGGLKVDPKSSAMSEEAVARRLKPVGEVVIGEAGAPVPATAAKSIATTSTAAAKPAGGAADGKNTYDAACAMCHAAGVAGAPKTGDKAAWKPRIAQGKDVLYTNAIKGKNLMPPKGGAASVPDADIKAAVDYLISQSK